MPFFDQNVCSAKRDFQMGGTTSETQDRRHCESFCLVEIKALKVTSAKWAKILRQTKRI